MTLPRYTGVTVQTTTNAPAPAATVTVNLHNTSTPADLFSDEAGSSPLANPLTSDAVTGLFTFCVANGLYDITVTGVALTPYTIPGVQLIYQGAPVTSLLVNETVLSNTAILQAPTTDASLLPAPGVGFRYRPFGLSFLLTATAGAYTNISTDYADLHIALGSSSGPNAVYPIMVNDNSTSPVLADLSGAFGAAVATLWDVNFPGLYAVGPAAFGNINYVLPNVNPRLSPLQWDNQPLVFGMVNGLGNLTGGDPTNTLRIRTYYLIEPTA